MRLEWKALFSLASLCLAAVAGHAAPLKPNPPQLIIESARLEYDVEPCLLRLDGVGFGFERPAIWLGARELTVVSWDDVSLTAEFDCETPPGAHRLAVARDSSRPGYDTVLLTVGDFALNDVLESELEFVHQRIDDEITARVDGDTVLTDALAAEATTRELLGLDMAAHAANPAAHHAKTVSFSELTDEASDSQIPNDITVDFAQLSGDVDCVGCVSRRDHVGSLIYTANLNGLLPPGSSSPVITTLATFESAGRPLLVRVQPNIPSGTNIHGSEGHLWSARPETALHVYEDSSGASVHHVSLEGVPITGQSASRAEYIVDGLEAGETHSIRLHTGNNGLVTNLRLIVFEL